MNFDMIETLVALCHLPDDRGTGTSGVTVYTAAGPFTGYPEIIGEDGTVQLSSKPPTTTGRVVCETMIDFNAIIAIKWEHRS